MIGPKVKTQRSCFDCEACVSESYRVQSDSGKDVYCTHPSLAERKSIGDTNWETPDWCPASIAAAPQFIAPEVTDEMAQRAWRRWDSSISPKTGAFEGARQFLDAWRAELGPQLGLVELREPSDDECRALYAFVMRDANGNESVGQLGRAMFDAVAKWLKGEL